MSVKQNHWRGRFFAASVHLGISLTIAGLAALLVFGFWYPYPYRDISGGRELFILVVAVDVILGPLLTFAIFNRSKSFAILRRDLTVIGCLQLIALVYGLWTVAVARPVYLVFEFDRFRVVHSIEVPAQSLDAAPPEFRRLPWGGPALLSLRSFKDNKEEMDATMQALQGSSLSAQPALWQNYEKAIPQVRKAMHPLAALKAKFPQRVAEIDVALDKAGLGSNAVSYVPMIGRQTFWTVLLDTNTAEVIAFVPIDSF